MRMGYVTSEELDEARRPFAFHVELPRHKLGSRGTVNGKQRRRCGVTGRRSHLPGRPRDIVKMHIARRTEKSVRVE